MNGIKEVLLKQKTMMVPYNRKDMQSLSLEIKAHQVKTYEGDLQNWGIPLTVITKETVQAKKTGITKSKRKRSYKPSTKRNDCLFKINCQYPNHHRNVRAKTQTRSNARLAEFRIEENQEERVGTNKI